MLGDHFILEFSDRGNWMTLSLLNMSFHTVSFSWKSCGYSITKAVCFLRVHYTYQHLFHWFDFQRIFIFEVSVHACMEAWLGLPSVKYHGNL